MDSNTLKIIRNSVCYHSGLLFQDKIGIILREYYANLELTYENPSSAGGDDKNDGWVKENGIYYQIYSPTNYDDSFTKNVLKKFCSDAKGLFENVYNKNLWKRPINQFIFIVNTRDQNVPKDSRQECEKIIVNLIKNILQIQNFN